MTCTITSISKVWTMDTHFRQQGESECTMEGDVSIMYAKNNNPNEVCYEMYHYV